MFPHSTRKSGRGKAISGQRLPYGPEDRHPGVPASRAVGTAKGTFLHPPTGIPPAPLKTLFSRSAPDRTDPFPVASPFSGPRSSVRITTEFSVRYSSLTVMLYPPPVWGPSPMTIYISCPSAYVSLKGFSLFFPMSSARAWGTSPSPVTVNSRSRIFSVSPLPPWQPVKPMRRRQIPPGSPKAPGRVFPAVSFSLP